MANRMSIRKEWTGDKTQMVVVRFCGDFLLSFHKKETAEKFAISYAYQRMGNLLAYPDPLTGKWEALSQYGYCLQSGFDTESQAKDHVYSFYKTRMKLILQ